MLFALFAAAVLIAFAHSLRLGHDSWGMTEMLIDYAGGFVRRGLLGDILRHISAWSPIPANILVVHGAFAVFVVLVVWGVRASAGRFPPALIVSPVLLGAPIYGDFVVRKDVLGLLVLVLALAVLRRSWPAPARFFALNALAGMAILNHEAFFFYGFCPLLFLSSGDGEAGSRRIHDLAVAFVRLLPAFLAFCAVIVCKGDPSIADAVNRSWLNLWKEIDPGGCCLDEPAAAIDALQWTTARGLSMSVSVLQHVANGIYVPLAWLLAIVFCGGCLLLLLDERPSSPSSLPGRSDLLHVLAFQLVCIAPLFVLGWDFGRWIAFWTCSSFVIFLSAAPRRLPFASTFARMKLSSKPAAPVWRESVLVLVLFFGLPGYHWTPWKMFVSSPVGYLVDRLRAH